MLREKMQLISNWARSVLGVEAELCQLACQQLEKTNTPPTLFVGKQEGQINMSLGWTSLET